MNFKVEKKKISSQKQQGKQKQIKKNSEGKKAIEGKGVEVKRISMEIWEEGESFESINKEISKYIKYCRGEKLVEFEDKLKDIIPEITLKDDDISKLNPPFETHF